MRFLFALCALLFSAQAFAQFSVVEWDADSRFRLLGQQWSPSFFSLAAIEPDQVDAGGARLSTYNYFTFATWTGDNMRFKFRVPFTYGTAGTDRFNGIKQNKAEFQFQDIILALQSSDMWVLPWDLGTYWEARIYLPTGESSSAMGKIASFRNEFIFTKMFAREFGLEYDQKLMYHMQSRTAYENTFENQMGFMQTSATLTKQFEVDHWVNAWYKVNPALSFGWKVGAEDTWWNRSAENGGASGPKSKEPEHLVKTGPSARFSFTKKANFLLSVDDKVAWVNRRELGRFLAKNTQVVLLSFITF
ncbi:MAG: hypothetical protein KF799_10155 [Bdellovibrionales bacterium]|nr:hypothetical protein [Bdellovibrionales bacterium]